MKEVLNIKDWIQNENDAVQFEILHSFILGSGFSKIGSVRRLKDGAVISLYDKVKIDYKGKLLECVVDIFWNDLKNTRIHVFKYDTHIYREANQLILK